MTLQQNRAPTDCGFGLRPASASRRSRTTNCSYCELIRYANFSSRIPQVVKSLQIQAWPCSSSCRNASKHHERHERQARIYRLLSASSTLSERDLVKDEDAPASRFEVCIGIGIVDTGICFPCGGGLCFGVH